MQLSEAADADLDGILAYGIEQFGEDTAEAYVRGFDGALALIAEFSPIGSMHDEVRPPIRSLPHGSHYNLYDVFDNGVVVQRMLHKSMNLERWL
ncbi:type II toxin-antitoxin system RelE/ParE family toxin [Sphingomonas sp. ID0503]|uniref:type II toxin-antitoxin system RelE/ParE family toxin n=1 Tax=Sphingomonas sp. ID0503 TaxID=3399691 RepID=UPI003AFA4911